MGVVFCLNTEHTQVGLSIFDTKICADVPWSVPGTGPLIHKKMRYRFLRTGTPDCYPHDWPGHLFSASASPIGPTQKNSACKPLPLFVVVSMMRYQIRSLRVHAAASIRGEDNFLFRRFSLSQLVPETGQAHHSP